MTDLTHTIDDAAADQLFREARTTYNWAPTEVPDAKLAEAWDLAKFGPTAMNCQPMRVRVVRTAEDKARLRPLAQGGNQDAIDRAPVQLILNWDPKFYENLPTFFPAAAGFDQVLAGNAAMASGMGTQSANLQAAYLIIALRAVGLAVGPMTGLDFPGINKEFFAEDGGKAFLVLNVGYAGEPANNFPRAPRLTWQEVTA